MLINRLACHSPLTKSPPKNQPPTQRAENLNRRLAFRRLKFTPPRKSPQFDVARSHCSDVNSTYQRLRGGATATHHSYGSPRLSDFFPAHLWRSDPPTDFDAKWLKRRAFTQGCALCSKIATFHTPRSPGPLKGQNLANFGLRKFSLDLAFTLEAQRENTP